MLANFNRKSAGWTLKEGGGGVGEQHVCKYYLVVKAMDLPILETQNKYVPGDFT